MTTSTPPPSACVFNRSRNGAPPRKGYVIKAQIAKASNKRVPHPPRFTLWQAMLINSANLMGGSSEPDGHRGFGRVHLEAGLPLQGLGDIGLFVADDVNINEYEVDRYTFETVESDVGEFRATLAWIDPPASTFSNEQLVHDLDLTVESPRGTNFGMWFSGATDHDNVIERVVVSEGELAQEGYGTWTVSVRSNSLLVDTQAYSLVVTGPFGNGTIVDSSSATPTFRSQCGMTTTGVGLLAWAAGAAASMLLEPFLRNAKDHVS